MGKNVKKILSVYDPRTHEENIKIFKGTEELLPSISIDVKKNGECSWHNEWVNSNPGNFWRGSCEKQRGFLFCDSAGYAKQKTVLSKDTAEVAEVETEAEKIHKCAKP